MHKPNAHLRPFERKNIYSFLLENNNSWSYSLALVDYTPKCTDDWTGQKSECILRILIVVPNCRANNAPMHRVNMTFLLFFTWFRYARRKMLDSNLYPFRITGSWEFMAIFQSSFCFHSEMVMRISEPTLMHSWWVEMKWERYVNM